MITPTAGWGGFCITTWGWGCGETSIIPPIVSIGNIPQIIDALELRPLVVDTYDSEVVPCIKDALELIPEFIITYLSEAIPHITDTSELKPALFPENATLKPKLVDGIALKPNLNSTKTDISAKIVSAEIIRPKITDSKDSENKPDLTDVTEIKPKIVKD